MKSHGNLKRIISITTHLDDGTIKTFKHDDTIEPGDLCFNRQGKIFFVIAMEQATNDNGPTDGYFYHTICEGKHRICFFTLLAKCSSITKDVKMNEDI